jgi:ribulose-phosphate 3-epimerase
MLENNNFKIGISILDCDYLNLGKELKKIEESGADFIHLDIMDGNFVPQIAFGQKMVSHLVKGSDLPVRTHLMIKNTDEQVESYVRHNPDSITVHAETCRHLDRVLSIIADSGISAGVALNPSTPVSFVENVLDRINSVLILTVNPGFGGQDFIEGMNKKIRLTREMINNHCSGSGRKNIIDIKVDGGINTSTIEKARDAGADTFIIGSSFFKSSNPAEFIKELKKILYGKQTI